MTATLQIPCNSLSLPYDSPQMPEGSKNPARNVARRQDRLQDRTDHLRLFTLQPIAFLCDIALLQQMLQEYGPISHCYVQFLRAFAALVPDLSPVLE